MVKAEESRAKIMQTIINAKYNSHRKQRDISLPSLGHHRNLSQPGLSYDSYREGGVRLNQTIERVVDMQKIRFQKKKKNLEKEELQYYKEIDELTK